jgi:hypothetical protein
VSLRWGRDANAVYYETSRVKGADPGSIRIVSETLAVDRRRAYVRGQRQYEGVGGHLERLRPLAGSDKLVTDGERVLITDHKIPGLYLLPRVDPGSILDLGAGYSRGSRHVH